MIRIGFALRAGAIAIGCFTLYAAASTFAAPVTRVAAVERLTDQKQYYSVPNFKIGGRYDAGIPARYEFGGDGGVTLESLGVPPMRLSYIAIGTPQRDAQGWITNAVIVSSFYSGDSTNMYHFWVAGQPGNDAAKGAVIGPGELIDTNRYYVVFLDALGLWGTSKPSEGLGLRFPRYSMYDLVQANYRLLRDHLKIGRIKLATGISMGALQSYTWAVLHPEEVEAIMPVAGITSSNSVALWLFDLGTAAIKSDPVWRRTGGDYYHLPKAEHPNQGVMFAWSIYGHTGQSFDKRAKEPWDDVRKEVFSWDDGEYGASLKVRAADMDAVEIVLRNEALHTYDLDPYLAKIKAKTLAIQVANDQWLILAPVKDAVAKIPGSKLVTYESPIAHYGSTYGPNAVRPQVEAFLKEIGMR